MASEGLGEYERKRSFEDTPEPRGGEGGTAAGRRFVIQEHSARRLHWDLRLEHDGVLLSWALPRGLPLDPDENRLAVRTEDHPIEYLDFEGTIPEGSYGAGEMRIVDSGTYEPEKLEDEKLVVELAGDEVGGRYAIFRTDGKNWLIHRMDPPPPCWEPLPERVEPMVASAVNEPSTEGGWAYEIEADGLRTLVYAEAGKLRLEAAEEERDLTALFPELRNLIRDLGIREALLDGVLTVLDESGRSDRERLQRRLENAAESTIRRRAKREPATLELFDLLHLDGRALLDAPWRERRDLLEGLGLDGPSWRVASVHFGDGAALLEAALEQGIAAIVAKRTDSVYEPGTVSDEWLRISSG